MTIFLGFAFAVWFIWPLLLLQISHQSEENSKKKYRVGVIVNYVEGLERRNYLSRVTPSVHALQCASARTLTINLICTVEYRPIVYRSSLCPRW
jgi:hypothetical protein